MIVDEAALMRKCLALRGHESRSPWRDLQSRQQLSGVSLADRGGPGRLSLDVVAIEARDGTPRRLHKHSVAHVALKSRMLDHGCSFRELALDSLHDRCRMYRLCMCPRNSDPNYFKPNRSLILSMSINSIRAPRGCD